MHFVLSIRAESLYGEKTAITTVLFANNTDYNRIAMSYVDHVGFHITVEEIVVVNNYESRPSIESRPGCKNVNKQINECKTPVKVVVNSVGVAWIRCRKEKVGTVNQ